MGWKLRVERLRKSLNSKSGPGYDGSLLGGEDGISLMWGRMNDLERLWWIVFIEVQQRRSKALFEALKPIGTYENRHRLDQVWTDIIYESHRSRRETPITSLKRIPKDSYSINDYMGSISQSEDSMIRDIDLKYSDEHFSMDRNLRRQFNTEQDFLTKYEDRRKEVVSRRTHTQYQAQLVTRSKIKAINKTMVVDFEILLAALVHKDWDVTNVKDYRKQKSMKMLNYFIRDTEKLLTKHRREKE